MLEQLRIENFVLVENVCFDFTDNLNIITGETGAGKSLIVDSLGLLLGERASNQYLRTGAERALVEGYFSYKHPKVAQILTEYGMEASEGDGILLSREITAGGRNYARIDGRIIPLNMFQNIARSLVDIHGQNEQLSLLSVEEQLVMLDARGGSETKALLDQVQHFYSEFVSLREQLKALLADPAERQQEMSYYEFQIKEIDEANLQDGEEEELLQRKKLLQNYEKLLVGVSEAYEFIFKGSQRSAAYDQVGRASEHLNELIAIDPALSNTLNLTNNCLYQLEEAGHELQQYLSAMDFDGNELDNVIRRLESVSQLKRKYGTSIKEILLYRQKAATTLAELADREAIIQKLKEKQAVIEGSYHAAAQALSSLRKKSAKRLEAEMQKCLQDLDMPRAQFKCEFNIRNKPHPKGRDELEFYISPNPGEPLKPLAKIASGGEMARIMLALKTILAEVDAVETMVFDEVDSGIGGLTATKVGQKLATIAQARQVICITHSPQIACFADAHFRLFKDAIQGRTFTGVEELTPAAKVDELARMLGGGPADATAIQHAKQLIQGASNKKCV